MKIVHFCAGLEEWNGMANTARQFVGEERGLGHDSILTNSVQELESCLKTGVDRVCIHGAWLPVLWKVSKFTKRYGAELYIRPAGSYDPVRLAYHAWKKRLVSWFEHRMLSRADVLLATCDAEVGWIRTYAPLVKKVEITDLKRFFNLSRVEGVVLTRIPRAKRVAEVDTLSGVRCSDAEFAEHDGKLTATDGGLHLLYLGRRHPLKGVEYLEKAVAELNSNPVNPVQRNSARPASLRLCVKIISSAFGEELEKVWDWCDILVLPTLSDNFGRVIAEAIERGKRVITTDGAPAWNDGNDYGGRLTYIKGYRDGTPTERVRLLQDAIESLI